jgi:hypothetical protein
MTQNHADYALVVGINHYPGFRNLKGAIEDAEDFAKWLYQDPEGGRLPQQNCSVVFSRPTPVRPIQDEIDDSLSQIFRSIGNNRGRRFYLYFSGHGLGQSNLGADLCLARWSFEFRRAALDSQDYLKLILGSGKFEEVAFFLDCCRVRLVNTRGLPSALGFARPADLSGQTKHFVGYATEFQNSSYEAAISESTPTGDEPIVRGHFTRALMNGLRGGAAVASGGVPAALLKQYLETETPRIAAASNQTQKPEVLNGLCSVPQAVFGSFKPTSMLTVTIQFKPGRLGPIVLEGPDLSEIRRDAPSTGPWVIGLEKGWHALRDLENEEHLTFRVAAAEGSSVNF